MAGFSHPYSPAYLLMKAMDSSNTRKAVAAAIGVSHEEMEEIAGRRQGIPLDAVLPLLEAVGLAVVDRSLLDAYVAMAKVGTAAMNEWSPV